MNRYVRTSAKILLWLVGILIVLIGLVFILIHEPFVHNIARKKVVSFLEERLQTPVAIDKLSLDFPKKLVLEGVYFQDQQGDTLLAGDTIRVDLHMWKLLGNEVVINEIDLRGITAYVNRTMKDTLYNFDYILRAFEREEDKDKPPIDSNAAMKFSLSKINLDRIHMKYADEITGKGANVYLRHFDTHITEFDLDNQRFTIPKITLSGITGSVHQHKDISAELLTPDTLNTKPAFLYPELKLGELLISDIHLEYDNVISSIDSKVDLEDLQIKFDNLDLKNQNVDLRSIQLSNTSGFFALGERAQQAVEATATEVAAEVKKGWSIQLDELDFENIDFKFDDLNSKELANGIDYNHLDVTDLNTSIKNILYTGDTLSANVQEFTIVESSGLDIRRFHADIFYNDKKAHLDNLLLETPRSIIRDQIRLTYPSFDTISQDIGLVGIDAQLIKNKIAVRDILLVAPKLSRKPFFRRNADAVIHVDGYVSGTVDDLSFSALDITGLGNTTVRASGIIRGLPDFERSHFDLNIAQFSTTATDLRSFIPAGKFPTTIRIPESMTLRGRFHGSLSNFDANLAMNSSLGAARLDGTLKNLTRKGRESYNARIQFNQFDLGQFLRNEDKIGKVTLNTVIKGSGTDIKTANASIDGTVTEAHYNGYTYQNLVLKGTAASGDLTVQASMKDPNITFNIDGTANFNGQYPTLNGTIDIDTINLQQLKLHEKDIRFSGLIIADLPTADPDHLNGTIQLANSIITLEGKRYKLDTVSIVSVASAEGDSIDINAEFMHFHAAGQYNLTQLVPAFQDQLNNYFNINPGADTTYRYEPQQIKFTLQFVRSPLVEQIFPELYEMEDAKITGSFDSETGEILVDGSMPRMRYKGFTLSNVNLDINTENNALNYAFGFDELNSPKFRVLKTAVTGKAQDDVLDVDLIVHDAEEKPRYRITGDLNSKGDAFDFSLAQQGLLLNYDPWNVAPDNSIAFGKQGLKITGFEISHNEQRLAINSDPPQFDAPLEIDFTDFQIETVTRLVTKDSLFAGGVVNGVANVKDMKDNLVFTSDLNIENFSFHGDTVGNIALKVNNQTPDTYAAEVIITGNGNQVNLTGTYFDGGDKSNYNLDMNIERLNVSSIEGFTGGEIDQGSGYITGDLKITGSSFTPQVRGTVRFRDAGFNITKFNSFYRVDDEELQFTDRGLTLNQFTLIDSSGNEAVVDGHILTQDYKDFDLDLNVRADDFQVLNSTRTNNKLYYGRLFVDTRLRITGGLNNPAVDGTLRVKENTRLTVVIPQTDPGIVEREGIVEFVDMDTFKITYISATPDSLVTSEVVGMDVAVNISIDRDAELNLIIDEANGDYLRVKGQADLLGGIDPSGKVTLTGTYELEEGAYSFSFNQLKREFVITKGSSITWNGEPMLADVNVTAVYTAETAPLSLVQNQLADADQSVINTYKQKLPFQIHLTMKGELLRPQIAFDIELPEKNYGVNSEIVSTVNARLVQIRTEPSELNKQVFAVLLLNRFISDDPFKNEARGAGISTLARQSASKLLSEQLNEVLGGMIAGFDLNFDINSIEDYTTGELQNRTDLTVGVSKRLLDDRLNINIGSQFELEGPKDTDRKTTNIAGDVSVEYQLSKDGRYLVRAYRKNEYIVVQGQVVETGLGFVFTADYEKVKDLFAKKTEEQKLAKKEERNARKEERREGVE